MPSASSPATSYYSIVSQRYTQSQAISTPLLCLHNSVGCTPNDQAPRRSPCHPQSLHTDQNNGEPARLTASALHSHSAINFLVSQICTQTPTSPMRCRRCAPQRSPRHPQSPQIDRKNRPPSRRTPSASPPATSSRLHRYLHISQRYTQSPSTTLHRRPRSPQQ